MESIEKLRDYYKAKDVPGVHRAINQIADEIEAEIAERYMLLPVDADGVPIRVGDVIKSDYEQPTEVTLIEIAIAKNEEPAYVLYWGDPMRYGDRDNDWGDFPDQPSSYRHVKPRTVEDVLADVLHDSYTMGAADVIAKYAAELRMVGE